MARRKTEEPMIDDDDGPPMPTAPDHTSPEESFTKTSDVPETVADEEETEDEHDLEDLTHEEVTPPAVEPIADAEARRIAYDAAFCAFLGAVQNPSKRRTAKILHKNGGEHSYKYADLSDVLATAKPVLARFGLGYTQDPVRDERGFYSIRTVLFHVGGHREDRGLFPVGTATGDPKAFGAALTYARRYALSLALGISSETDTDAGNGGERFERGNPNAWRDEVERERLAPPRNRELPAPRGDGPPQGDYRPAPRTSYPQRTERPAAGVRTAERHSRPADDMTSPGDRPAIEEPVYSFLPEHEPTVSEFRAALADAQSQDEVYRDWTDRWSPLFRNWVERGALSKNLYEDLLAEAQSRRRFLHTQEQMRTR